jgi:hypothetical protein
MEIQTLSANLTLRVFRTFGYSRSCTVHILFWLLHTTHLLRLSMWTNRSSPRIKTASFGRCRGSSPNTFSYYEYPAPPGAGIGQSSSVILDQNIHTITTASSVKRVSNMPPLIFPFVLLQMWTLMTYWKTWPMMKRSAAPAR